MEQGQQSPPRDGGFELVEGDIAADASADNQGEQGDAAQANAHPLVDWQSADDDDIEEEDTSDWGTEMYEEEIALMSDFSGADSMFSDDDEEDDDDMVTDESEWEDVDDGNDSVYSIPPTRANLSASGDPLLWGLEEAHDPRTTSVCHGGACFLRKGRVSHPALSHTFHKQAADSIRMFENVHGSPEFLTVAGSMQQAAIGVWPLNTNPAPVSIHNAPSNADAAERVTGQPPQLATRVGDRPLTLVPAHGGRIIMTGGEGGLLEVFARYPLPLHPVLPHDQHTCTARSCHDCTHRAASEAASLALSEAAARAAVEAAKREGGSNAAAEVLHERLVPAWIIQTDAMVNYLSVGMVAGVQRLLISAQHTVRQQSLGYVHVLEIPPAGSQQPRSMQCEAQELLPPGGHAGGQGGNTTTDMDVYERGEFGLFLRRYGMVDPQAGNFASSVRAVSIGSWSCAVNCAVASPDGEWIAVVGDDLRVWLLSRKTGYRYGSAVVLSMRNPPVARRHQHGFQYVAWSHDSTRVAATADSSAKCVCIWDVCHRQQTHHIAVDRSLMGVAFAPWDNTLLVCAARREKVHIIQLLPEGKVHHQELACGMVRRPMPDTDEYVQCVSRVITGVTIDAATRSLFIAQRFRVLQYFFVRPWALNTHGDFPEAFLAAARTLLLAAKRVEDEDTVGLWSLPRDTILYVLKLAADPLHAWFKEEAAVDAPA